MQYLYARGIAGIVLVCLQIVLREAVNLAPRWPARDVLTLLLIPSEICRSGFGSDSRHMPHLSAGAGLAFAV